MAAGSWVWPVNPVQVLRGFDPPPSPWLAGHRGVDLAAAAGQVVRSSGRGVVAFAGRLAGEDVIVVKHGDLRTTYESVQPDVRVGASVDAGQPIGRVRAWPAHCGVRECLHWGLLRGAIYVDPRLLVSRGTVVLLPLGVIDTRPARMNLAAVTAERPSVRTAPPGWAGLRLEHLREMFAGSFEPAGPLLRPG